MCCLCVGDAGHALICFGYVLVTVLIDCDETIENGRNIFYRFSINTALTLVHMAIFILIICSVCEKIFKLFYIFDSGRVFTVAAHLTTRFYSRSLDSIGSCSSSPLVSNMVSATT